MNPSTSPSPSYRVGDAVRRAMLAAAMAATAIASAPTFAAEADAETELEAVVVTGSRIASANMTSTSPILTVTSEEIKASGRTDVTDMLNMLPQMNSNSLGQDLGNRTSGLTSAGGVATADLRGLGPNRTLVLVDGRRLGTGSPQTVIQSPAPDIDQIPGALVERVEVVTGGASAVYGSDALAGVVNFIMKKNFEGLELDAQVGGNWDDNDNGFAHQRVGDAGYEVLKGAEWDGRTVNFNVTAGANIMDGRGNVTAYFGYSDMQPVASSQRDFGGCQMFYNSDLTDLECSGSSNANYFYPTNPAANIADEVYSVQGSGFVPWGTEGTTPPYIFNSQKYIYMQRQDTRYNAGFMAHVDINDHARPYAEFSFMNDQTHQEVAPTALFRGANPLSDTGNYLINCSNPLLSASQRSLMCTSAEVSADTLEPGSANADVEIGRRNVEGGGRTYDYEHTNYRMVLGSKGDIADGWTYDAYGQFYYTNFSNFNGKDFGFDKIANALQVTGTAANPVCISGGACVPYNIFKDGGVTEEAVRYLETVGTATGSTKLVTYHADFTGDLGVYGLKLPTADDGLGVNAGYEYRKETVVYKPDAASESGLIVGAGGASPRLDDSLASDELFAEIRLPIAQGKPGIYDLVVDAGYRYSDYSTGVSTDTYKAELQYAPIQDVRFRASFNHAVRVPAIVELYNPQLVGKIAFGEDPCAPSEDDGTLAATLQECLNTGVTTAQYNSGSIPQGTAGQLTQLQGGNPALSPEEADTYTIGVTLQPLGLPNFTGSIDYYHIEMKNLIGALDATIIMDNCMATGDAAYCSQIVRHPITGTLNGASVASGGYLVQTNVNIGAGELDGIDLQAAYKFDLGNLGDVRLMMNGAYMLKNETTPLPGGGSYDCTGLFGPTCQTVNPEWRHNLRAAWSLPHNVDVSLTWRYLGGVKLDNNDSNPLLEGSALGAPAVYRADMGSVSYFDLSAGWEIGEHLQLRAGVNNILDRDPPLAPTEIISGGAPNYYEFYDGLGRQAFLGITARF
jgi:iron complex outermembrane recepter protein